MIFVKNSSKFIIALATTVNAAKLAFGLGPHMK